MNRSIFAPLIAAFLIPALAMAQTGPTYMLPTTISVAGSYPSGGISVGPPNNTAVIELQATGSGSGLSFKMQGIPIGSTTPVDLQMYTAPACGAAVSTGSANGDWFIPVAGFSKVYFVLISGTPETYGITNSTQGNCASSAAAAAGTGNATAANQATQITAEQTTATQTTAINSKLGSALPLPTGASSAANQTNVQSAPGTPQTTANTVQGNAGGVPIPVSGSISLLPTSSSTNALTPISSTAAESSHVLKNSAGNFYGVTITPTVAGYLLVFNATSAPSDGAVTPIFCVPVSANTASGLSTRGGIPTSFSTGIVVVFSTTGCFTKTASATASFTGMVQ